MNASVQTATFSAEDGYTLGGTLFEAPGSDTTVIVHSATAVPHGFYRRFATHLQAHGWTVLTYDFRGIGASKPPSLVGFEGKASDWGLKDMPASLRWVEQTLSPRRLFFVGHSAGGQQAGLLADPARVDAMATVSSQSGFWAYQGGIEKLRVLVMMGLVVPILARTSGYLPWSRIAAGEDLPRNAALEWARWCRSSKYILGDHRLPLHRYDNFTAPVLAYSIDDDPWGTARSVDAMMSAYPNVERHHLVPASHGLSKLGHMGYFREGAEPLWNQLIEWFEQQTP